MKNENSQRSPLTAALTALWIQDVRPASLGSMMKSAAFGGDGTGGAAAFVIAAFTSGAVSHRGAGHVAGGSSKSSHTQDASAQKARGSSVVTASLAPSDGVSASLPGGDVYPSSDVHATASVKPTASAAATA